MPLGDEVPQVLVSGKDGVGMGPTSRCGTLLYPQGRGPLIIFSSLKWKNVLASLYRPLVAVCFVCGTLVFCLTEMDKMGQFPSQSTWS